MLPNKLNFYPEDKLTFINKVNCFLLFATNLDRKEFPNKEIHPLKVISIHRNLIFIILILKDLFFFKTHIMNDFMVFIWQM